MSSSLLAIQQLKLKLYSEESYRSISFFCIKVCFPNFYIYRIIVLVRVHHVRCLETKRIHTRHGHIAFHVNFLVQKDSKQTIYLLDVEYKKSPNINK